MNKRWAWGVDAQGNARVWLHWQNLNEDKRGNVKGLPWHGRRQGERAVCGIHARCLEPFRKLNGSGI
jgi:hypothetical protein